jgi:hypothetical protein
VADLETIRWQAGRYSWVDTTDALELCDEVDRLRAAITEHRDEFIVLDLGPGPVDLDQFEAVTARDARLWAVLEEPSDG